MKRPISSTAAAGRWSLAPLEGAGAGGDRRGGDETLTRLLIYEPSWRRLEADLASWKPAIEAVLIDAEGRLTLHGAATSVETANPHAAWFNREVFEGPAARAFVIATLKALALKWVQTAAAGFDHPVFAQIVNKGARLTTSHGQAVGMADTVVAGVLDHFQRGPERRAAQAARAWRPLPFREVLDSSWLIIGFGAIGQAVAERARAFGARITGVRRDQAPHPLADRIAPLATILDLLPGADVVVLCAPLAADTHQMANEAFFAAMKTGSVLVNVGRGGLVDEPALLAALDRGRPAHAALDVFAVEPVPETSVLWAHPAVSLTPHASGMTGGQDARNEATFLDNLRRFSSGEPLVNEVDPKDVLTTAN